MRAVVRVVDIETTGFDDKVDGIVEIACTDLLVDGDEIRTMMRAISRLCNPGIRIPPTARAIHHISDAMVGQPGTPSATELATKALMALPSTSDAVNMPIVFAAHHADFDRGFLERVAINTPPRQWIDTCRLARKLWPQLEHYGNQVLRYELFPDDEFTGQPHRAQHDVEVTARLLERELMEIAQNPAHERIDAVDALIAYIAAPIDLSNKPIGFGKHEKLTWLEARNTDRGYLQWMIREHNKELEDTGKGAWDLDQWHTIRLLTGYGV